MFKLVSILLILATALTFKGCEPFGPRVFYGKTIQDPSIPTKLSIYFNTVQPCTKSYVQLVRKSGLVKIQCKTETLSLSKNTEYYNTSLHKCETNVIDW